MGIGGDLKAKAEQEDIVLNGADLLEVLTAAKELVEWTRPDGQCEEFDDAWVNLKELVEK